MLNLEPKTDDSGGYQVTKIVTHPTRHTSEQVFFADGSDRDWVFNTLTELNGQLGGTAQVINGTDGTLTIVPSDTTTNA